MPKYVLALDLDSFLSEGHILGQKCLILNRWIARILRGIGQELIESGYLSIKIFAERENNAEFRSRIADVLNAEIGRPDETSLISIDNIIFYQVDESRYDINFSFDDEVDIKNILFLSSDPGLIQAVNALGANTTLCCHKSEIDPSAVQELASLEGVKGRVRVYIDIDDTVLNFLETSSREEIILNDFVIQQLLDIRKKYPKAEFTIITSRVWKDAEDDPGLVGSTASVIQALEKTGIVITKTLYTGKHEYLEDGKMVHTVEKDKVEKILECEQENPSSISSIVIFFDDSPLEIGPACACACDFNLYGITFIPMPVYHLGNPTARALNIIFRFLEKVEGMANEDKPPSLYESSQTVDNSLPSGGLVASALGTIRKFFLWGSRTDDAPADTEEQSTTIKMSPGS